MLRDAFQVYGALDLHHTYILPASGGTVRALGVWFNVIMSGEAADSLVMLGSSAVQVPISRRESKERHAARLCRYAHIAHFIHSQLRLRYGTMIELLAGPSTIRVSWGNSYLQKTCVHVQFATPDGKLIDVCVKVSSCSCC